MRNIIALITVLVSGGFGYFLGINNGNAAIEDMAVMNILSGLAIAHYFEKSEFNKIKESNYINIGSNLNKAIEKEGGFHSNEFEVSKTRAMNALYQRWKENPPRYYHDFTDQELKNRTIKNHKRQMQYLKKFHDQCLRNKELECKGS